MAGEMPPNKVQQVLMDMPRRCLRGVTQNNETLMFELVVSLLSRDMCACQTFPWLKQRLILYKAKLVTTIFSALPEFGQGRRRVKKYFNGCKKQRKLDGDIADDFQVVKEYSLRHVIASL